MGAQWLYAKSYVQVVGFIDQAKINLDPADMGGGKYTPYFCADKHAELIIVELDPHGADEQGNPLGGAVYSNGFGQSSADFAQQISSNSTGPNSFTQVTEWIE